MELVQMAVIFLGGLGAGFVNALAGGGTLISFPALLFAGIPPVSANVTSIVALLSGYFGAMGAQKDDLIGQGNRLLWFIPMSILGGCAGGFLLMSMGEHDFRTLVPYLIVAAAGVLGFQTPIKAWLSKVHPHRESVLRERVFASVALFGAAIYGGFFGAGVSVIVLAVLGITQTDSLNRLNALKHAIGLATNLSAAAFFVFNAPVVWSAVFLCGSGAVLGGWLGGKLAHRIDARKLRMVVVVMAVSSAVVLLV